jgi:aspartyl-tRNA(Asn)/glutamyl-tRNA(Gln) amidotransferase subunit C
MQLEDIKKLAALARIDMPESDLREMANDFDPILAYVGQIAEVKNLPDTGQEHLLTNIMREDVPTHKTGECTEKLIEQMPDSQDGFLKVKQIL